VSKGLTGRNNLTAWHKLYQEANPFTSLDREETARRKPEGRDNERKQTQTIMEP
jgi:hypothetical protein